MMARLNMDKIAAGLGGERRGKVEAKGGYFGAVQLLADIEDRFQAPAGGHLLTAPHPSSETATICAHGVAFLALSWQTSKR